MTKVDVIIPVYYCDESLFLPIEMCFSTLHACYPWIEPYGIDDCSPLDVPSHWPIQEYNAVNEGYTATVNRGLRNTNGDIVIVANDDLQFIPHSLDRFFDLPDGVVASPADTASGDSDRFGAIFGMTRNTLNQIGYLDEKYRNFYSDEDYYNRAKALGIEIVKWRDIVLPHVESATFKLVDKKSLFEADKSVWEDNK
jgi:hypothetical protein